MFGFKNSGETPHKNKISEDIEQNMVDFCVLPRSSAAG
jgi:hypothetical protein